ncbi:hypothetical protein EA007_00310 [Vibrio anguillarum]|uniref:hypothetical protein n=2 Tax=Vibrio anguillarum TaxID=55601 RepID=UPI00188AF6A6|nr:hypothetical protein [Vibrio anguillarum]MBF4249473.1 hypothetical protein [Vibrio anguillarum]
MRNYTWSEPEDKEVYTYSNEFGELTLEPVTPFMPVSEISSDTIPEIQDVLVSLDCAEQVTLITGNARASMSVIFPFPNGTDIFSFALKYSCSNRAAVCRVSIQSFKTNEGIGSAQEQIEAMRPKCYGPLPVY